MTERPLCAVPWCLLSAREGHQHCGLHINARTAESLGISKTRASASAGPAQKCTECHRQFQPEDYVSLDTTRRTITDSGRDKRETRLEYRHVSCHPAARKPTRKQAREGRKPLLEVL